jgi:hypothetical protein
MTRNIQEKPEPKKHLHMAEKALGYLHIYLTESLALAWGYNKY